MRHPIGNLTRTLWEALSILLESHFLGERTNRRPERSLNITKSGANSVHWHMARKVIMEDRERWSVNSFMLYKAPGPDGIYAICLKKGLDLTIKCLIKLYRD